MVFILTPADVYIYYHLKSSTYAVATLILVALCSFKNLNHFEILFPSDFHKPFYPNISIIDYPFQSVIAFSPSIPSA